MSVNFDGTADSFFDLGDVPNADFSELLFWTVLAFFRISDTTGDESTIVAKWASGSSNRQFRARVTAGDAPQSIEVAHSNVSIVTSATVIEEDTWYLFSLSQAGQGSNNLIMNVVEMDGTLVVDNLAATLVSDRGADVAVTIGGRPGNDPYIGDIAYVSYLKRVLSQNEILEYLRNPAKVVNRVGAGTTGPAFFLPMFNLATTPDWSGQANTGARAGSGHTTGDNPPVTLYTGLDWQGAFTAAAAAARRIFMVS